MDELRLVGVGMGPGDPELVTLKAVRVLTEAAVVLVPQTEAGTGRAEALVRVVCPQANVVAAPFSMEQRRGVGEKRTAAWRESAALAVSAFDDGATMVAFATIGDPNVYSTFAYLAAFVADRVPGLRIETVPGITAFQALASASGTSLVEGREPFTLVSLTAGITAVAKALDAPGSVVVYKVGREARALAELLSERNRRAILGVDIGLETERLAPFSTETAELPYMSTVLIPAERSSTGSSL
jgi:precorrin-2/cobalt-factor-2 C20-methyltransferase